jgi:hypothetical protein
VTDLVILSGLANVVTIFLLVLHLKRCATGFLLPSVIFSSQKRPTILHISLSVASHTPRIPPRESKSTGRIESIEEDAQGPHTPSNLLARILPGLLMQEIPPKYTACVANRLDHLGRLLTRSINYYCKYV